MKKSALVFVLVISALLITSAYSAEKEDFWSSLKSKVNKLAPAKSGATTTAVGGVRGAKEDGDAVYWKGKEAEKTVPKAELDSFSSALDAAQKGDKAEAKKRFEAFVKKYPSSALAEDARKSIEMLEK